MIIFELVCEEAHEFEGWFKDHAAFQEQLEKSLVQCPICGSNHVTQCLSTGGKVSSKHGEADATKSGDLFRAIRDVIETHFEDVGSDFAKTALKIHYGVEEPRNIRGTSTEAEEEVLRQEGVKFHKIPMISEESKLN